MRKFIIAVLVLIIGFSSTVLAQNYVMDFDGIDDYVRIPNHPSYSFGTDDFTVSFWFLKRDNDRGHALTFNGLTGNNLCFDFDDEDLTGGVNIWVYWMGTGNPYILTPIDYSDGTWHHLTFTRAGNLLTLYVDGIIVGQDTYTGSFSCGGDLLVGWSNSYFTYSFYWDGKIDEIEIWNVAVDQTTIQSWMNQPLSTAHPYWSNLVGYYQFNEGSGQTVLDSSPNANHGQLGGLSNPDGQDPNWGLSDNPLPVQLSSFTAVQTAENLAQINWITQSESNLIGYNVYRNNTDSEQTLLQINPNLIEGTNTTQEQTYSFTDANVNFEQTYYYWLESVEADGNADLFGPISITLETPSVNELPTVTVLNSAYPNPFNPSTIISFDVKESETGHLSIFNAKGQKLFGRDFTSGNHTYTWNADEYGSGIYMYRFKTDSYSETKRMIMMK